MAILLTRSNQQVNNFMEAVSSYKETDFTAYLAYLIAAFPRELGSVFVENGEQIQEIKIEHVTESKDRYDIVLVTNRRLIVIEAKLGFVQQKEQILRYVYGLAHSRKKCRTTLFLLDYGSFQSSSWLRELSHRKVEIVSRRWDDIYNALSKLLKYTRCKKSNETAFAIAEEISAFMEASGMIQQKKKEVYVRDLKGDSIELFFRYKIYKCQPMFYKSAQGNQYFAPYFTGQAPRDFEERSMIRIEQGLTWMAPIREIQCLKRSEIKEYLRAKGHPHYREATREIFRESKREELLILYLGDPFLAFLTPISKKKLSIRGAMGSRSFSFEDLFVAAGKGG